MFLEICMTYMEHFKKRKSHKLPTPYFSVIIATYNRAHLIRRALDSLIAQTEKNWEAVIVDDESSDGTDRIITSYLKKYPAIRYISKQHNGEAMAKNAGIWATTGRYITFLDSDDEYMPDHLKIRRQILLGNPEVRLLYGGATIIGSQYVPDRFNQEKLINLKDCVIGGTLFLERNMVVDLGGFKKIYLGTDSDLFDRAKRAGFTMMEVTQPTYIYHHETDDSITNRLLSGLISA